MPKQVTLFFTIVGLALIASFPFRGILHQSERQEEIKGYEEAVYLTKSVGEIKKELQEINQQEIIDPFGANGSEEVALPFGALGYLDIPKIGEQLPLYIGASEENLQKGVAQITGTALPMEGMGTHTFIAGHRMTAHSNMFLFIDQLIPGDLFFLNYLGKTAVYVVTGNEIIFPNQGEKLLEVNEKEENLTLLTCHPFPTTEQRLLVHSKRLTDVELKKIDINKIQSGELLLAEESPATNERGNDVEETSGEMQTKTREETTVNKVEAAKAYLIKNNGTVYLLLFLCLFLLILFFIWRFIVVLFKKK